MRLIQHKYKIPTFRDYLNHFIKNPHSLIVKIMGVFHVKIAKKPPVYFIIMQSVFFPDTNMSVRYDIKGCLAGRYQTPGVLGDNQEVYKDKNFDGEYLMLGEDKRWFLKQVFIHIIDMT